MQIEEELAGFSPEKDTLLTIGVFDGVHLGHKHLLSQLTEQARQQNRLSGVVTFRQHPREQLSPQTELPFLASLAQRVNLLKNEGIEIIIILSFTIELAQLSARRFISMLKRHIRMRGLVIGPDFALGQNREGNAENLCRLGKDMDFTVSVIPALAINGEVVSSTAIRKALAKGDMKKVTRLADRPFSLSGKVVSGADRGTRLGFPTANMDIDPEQTLPKDGVYATRAYIGDKIHQSMTNVGRHPTFDSSERLVEVHVLGYNSNLYGRELKIDFVERLRGEKQFNTTEELKQQITEDIKRGKAILGSRSKN